MASRRRPFTEPIMVLKEDPEQTTPEIPKHEFPTKGFRFTFQPQSVLTYDDARNAMTTEVDIAYARIMLLGPAGVGKTSLVRGLKKLPFIRESTSTQVAEVRPVSYGWSTGDWKDVNEEDELDEVAKLLATVYHDLHSVEQLVESVKSVSEVKSVRALYEGNSSVPSSEVKEEQVKEVETTKVEFYLKKAISRAEQITTYDIQLKRLSPFFHVWDCGGQPVFLEVLPAFLTPRTMFLLLFDASKDFQQTWKSIQYEAGTVIPGEESNMTIIELLDRWMATIHSHLSRKTKKGGLVEYPRILGIGTHGDLLNEEQKRKVIEDFDKYCGEKAYYEILDNEEILIVDNSRARTDSEFRKLHKIIRQFATKNLVVKTPVSWVLFRKVLQIFSKESKNVISFNEAKAIGIACKIEAKYIHKVLMFYHDLGVILFYPQVKSFKHKVILNPKWFVESLSKILTLRGREIPNTSNKMWRLLREKGILVQPLYVALWSECTDLTPEGMMELLIHFRLAAKVETQEYYDLDAPQYFVPSVLPLFPGDLSAPTTAGSMRATPLHITFSTKFVTPGYFTRLVSTIASFEVCKLYFEKGIYRNRVVFEFTPDDKQYNFVTLTELPYAIQVDKTCESPDNQMSHFRKSCQNLLVLLDRSCKEVDECFYQSFPSDDTQAKKIHRNEFTFLCISDKCRSAENPHYLDKTSENKTCCQLRQQFRDLEEEESYWFQQVLQSAKSNEISEKEIVQISQQIEVGYGGELAALLGRKIQWEEILQNPHKLGKPVSSFLLDWNQQDGRRDELVHHLQTLKLLKLAKQIKADHDECDMDSYRSDTLLRKRRVSSNPPQQPLEESTARQPTPKRSQSAPHLIQVHHQKKHSSPMKQVLEEIESEDKFQDSTSVDKLIDLLLENEKFVQKVKTIQLAEKRAGDESNGGATSLDGFQHDDSWSARSRSTNSRPESSPVNSHSETLPPSLPAIQPPDVDNIPHTDIVRCCNFIKCNINYLASVMELPKDEIAAITRSTSDKQTQILDIVKTWISKNPNKQKEDLQELLMSAKLEDAARSLMDPSYTNRCNFL